jgi:NOL1/NOP2/fmu family ribosome biogenesis protein
MKTPVEILLDNEANWVEVEGVPPTDGSLYATHEGSFKIGEIEMKCYRLSDGQAVIDTESMNAFFGIFNEESK